jgi:competence protein ComEA
VIDLNRVERRALLVTTLLVVLAALGRTALVPGKESFAWRPAENSEAASADLATLRRGVSDGLLREQRAHTPLAPGERLDPNSAPEEELRRLPGIGPTRARAIIEQRAAGEFHRREDLLRVSGIGAVTLDRIAPHLRFPPGAPAAARSIESVRVSTVGVGKPASRPLTRPTCAPGASGLLPRVDLNRADFAALVTLPTIGPARAMKILRSRERQGPFTTVEELLDIPGIGPRTLDRLRARVCVG